MKSRSKGVAQRPSWSELEELSREAKDLIKALGKEVDQQKCQVKRGVIETEVEMVQGILKL